jgi:hypothetical protein
MPSRVRIKARRVVVTRDVRGMRQIGLIAQSTDASPSAFGEVRHEVAEGRGSMRKKPRSRIHADIPPLAIATLALLLQPSGNAIAGNLLGLYVGGAVGQGEVAANVPNPFVPNPFIAHVPVPASDSFKADHSAFKVMVGLRPIPMLGAELSYLDLGNPTGSLFGHPASASMKGISGFGVIYLPIPVIDVFAKAGAARIQSTVSGYAPNGIPDFICLPNIPCGTSPFREDRTNTNFAAGAGAQFKFGGWAVRAEYERFSVASENPHLLSLGLTWSF